MRLEAVELRVVELPLVSPFRTSFGTEVVKECIVVRAVTDAGEGWGECVAMTDPFYSSEFLTGAAEVLRRWLVPAAFAAGDGLTADSVGPLTAAVKDHRMAKAALEMAVLDAELRAAGVSLAARLGATETWVPSGVSVGIQPSIAALVEVVDGYLADGYRRIKLKIEPGFDVDAVRAVRDHIGPEVLLQVDANTAYTVADADHLARLDDLDLLLIEQPLAEDDVAGHVELARRLRTPICLDESIVSAAGAVDALDRGACSVVNIKAGRVGGYLEAVRVHDACRARGVPVWCGGMVETGIGRAANAALA
ncbi:MAG: o-succinylbenzoate synthase, partial [Acidimicrobiales bacterium]|nr:o-succinylbenzoate synthase [Acidimicrobiales bacterium]